MYVGIYVTMNICLNLLMYICIYIFMYVIYSSKYLHLTFYEILFKTEGV